MTTIQQRLDALDAAREPARRKVEAKLKQIHDNSDKAQEIRQEILDDFFASIEDEDMRLKLQQFQWEIDKVRRKYKNPVACMNKLGEMMFDELLKLLEVVNDAVAGKENKNETESP